jgi:FkbM family methyltransferase
MSRKERFKSRWVTLIKFLVPHRFGLWLISKKERPLVAMASLIKRIRPHRFGFLLSETVLDMDSRLRGREYRIRNLRLVRSTTSDPDFLAKSALIASHRVFLDLRQQPLGFYDVGARGGPWIDSYFFGEFLTAVLCEPDRSQRRHLSRTRGFQKVYVETRLIGASPSTTVFYQTRKPGGSSTLKPKGINEDAHSIVRTTIREIITIDQIQNSIDVPCEALKIDTQGNELSVLKGLTQNPYCIRVEVSTLALYEGSSLADEIVLELSQRDYVMISDPSLLQIQGFHGDLIFSWYPQGDRQLTEACDPLRWLVAHAALGGLRQPHFRCPTNWACHRDFVESIVPASLEIEEKIAQVVEENGSRFVRRSQKKRVR